VDRDRKSHNAHLSGAGSTWHCHLEVHRKTALLSAEKAQRVAEPADNAGTENTKEKKGVVHEGNRELVELREKEEPAEELTQSSRTAGVFFVKLKKI
jgi:hypothetical protein